MPRQRTRKPTETRTDDRGTWLLAHGWRQVSGACSVWEWYDPKLPGARYTLEHAYDVARSNEPKIG